jgi:hypothetical protein
VWRFLPPPLPPPHPPSLSHNLFFSSFDFAFFTTLSDLDTRSPSLPSQ